MPLETAENVRLFLVNQRRAAMIPAVTFHEDLVAALEIQAQIEALDRIIEDERRLADGEPRPEVTVMF